MLKKQTKRALSCQTRLQNNMEHLGLSCSVADVTFSPSRLQSDSVNVKLSAKSLELISLPDLLAIVENAINLSKVAALMQKSTM